MFRSINVEVKNIITRINLKSALKSLKLKNGRTHIQMKILFIILGIGGCFFTGCNALTNRCSPAIESNELETRFSLRKSGGQDCSINEDSYSKSIRMWLNQRTDETKPIEGYFLGRAIDYPWISQHLAEAAFNSKEWDLKTGTSHEINLYRLVEFFLIEEEFKARLDAPFVNTPYMVSSVSVEKVLIQDVSLVLDKYEKGSGKVPFDALLSVEMVKR